MKPGIPTRVPAQIDKLLELFDAQLVDVKLYDGAPLQSPDEPDVLVVAPSTTDQSGVEVEYVEQPGLGARYVEQSTIVCVVSSWSGDEDMRAARNRVHEIVGHIRAVLDANQVVEDCWDAVGFATAADWYLIPTETGSTAAFGFAIVCRSLT